MFKRFFIGKICITVCVTMLYAAAIWLYMTSPVHAVSLPTTAAVDKDAPSSRASVTPAASSPVSSVLTEGTQDSCKWEYRQEKEGIVFYISPASEPVGEFKILDKILPSWLDDSVKKYRTKTERIVVQKTVRPIGDCPGLFSGFEKVKSIDLSGLDTSKMTSMAGMFQGCSSLTALDVSTCDVSQVTDMGSMFQGCSSLTSLGDIRAWNTAAVTCTREMFQNCRSLTSLDLSGWDVAQVRDMTRMFSGCHALTNLGLNNWGDVVRQYAPRHENGMFNATPSLKRICLGSKFFIASDSGLENSGIYVGSHWAQVDEHSDSARENALFSSADELISSHNAGRNESTSARCYIRQARTKGSCGDCWWEYVLLNKKGSDGKNLYALHIDPSEDNKAGTLGSWAEDASAAPPWRQPFCREYYTHTTALVIDKPIKALTCVGMFKDFKLLQEANLSGLDVSSLQGMTEMFTGASSLEKIYVKRTFHFADDAGFDEAGTGVGTHWAREGDGGAGQSEQVFASARELVDFHNKKIEQVTHAGIEKYFRITSELVVMFDKGADDVQGTMDPERFSYNEEKAFTKNVYQRDGYTFVGWKDVQGKLYRDEQLFKNEYLGRSKSIILTAQWKADTSSVTSDASGSNTKEVPEPATSENSEPKTTEAEKPKQKEFSKKAADFCKSLEVEDSPVHTTPKRLPKKSESAPVVSAQPTVLQGWFSTDGKVHYYRDGKKLVGWYPLRGTIKNPSSNEENWFYFDEQGIMLTGRHKLVGGIKNDRGFQDEHVFFLDENTGAERRGWLRFFENGEEHWYHCRKEDGVMLTGQQELVGGLNQRMNWFYFDPETGIELRESWKEFTDQKKWCYYAKDGTMLKGQHCVFGGDNQRMNWFYFDLETGAELRNSWKEFPDQNKWCYYGSDGAMLKGQHQLPGGDDGGMHWFYFDEVTGAECRNCWKPIPSQGKVCYYGSDGAMYKGWREIYGKSYYFDETTGAVRS